MQREIALGGPGMHPGGYDFYAYWIGYRLFIDGKNPYDLQLLQAAERAAGERITGPIFYPPWVFSVLSPWLSLRYEDASILWFLTNIFLALLTILLACRMLSMHAPGFFFLAACILTFMPVWDVINFGQVGIFITASIYGSYLLLQKSKPVSAGCLMSISFLKPHLSLLCFLSFFVHSFTTRQSGRFIAGFSFALLAIGVAPLLVQPDIYDFWRRMENPFTYASVSLVSPFRSLAQQNFPEWDLAIAFLIPLLGGGLFLSFLLRLEGPLRRMMFALLIGSVTAPYIWVFDLTILFIAHISLLAFCLQCPRDSASLLWIIVTIFCIACHLLDVIDYRIWWYSTSLLGCVLLMEISKRKKQSRISGIEGSPMILR